MGHLEFFASRLKIQSGPLPGASVGFHEKLAVLTVTMPQFHRGLCAPPGVQIGVLQCQHALNCSSGERKRFGRSETSLVSKVSAKGSDRTGVENGECL